VKDGEVPVTVVRRAHPAEALAGVGPAVHSQIEAARQTIRSQAVAAERAERALNDAQATIRDLRTKLAHERLAKDEVLQALRRAETERDAAQSAIQAMRTDLATERVGREKLEQELRKALDAHQAAETRTQAPLKRRGRPPKPAIESGEPAAPPRKRGRPRNVVLPAAEPTTPALPRKRGRPRKLQVAAQAELVLGTEQMPRRRGRPPKVREPKPVKWWVKGWKPTGG
jgi:hypothetical protein